MKRVSFKAFMPCVVLVLSAFFCACEMQLGNIVLDTPASVRSVVSLMNRSDAERMLYMGGSVLYSPKDSNASQLVEGAAVATRIGKVEKIDLGNGNYAYRNSKTDYELGFIVVDAISKEEISFSYYKFPSANSNSYVSAGSYTLLEGQTADLNGNGYADVKYTKPDAGRKGYKSNMWLTFLSDVEEVLHHTHHQSFSKPSWSGKERNFIIRIMHKFIHDLGLIHIVCIFITKSRKVRFSNAYCKGHMRASFQP